MGIKHLTNGFGPSTGSSLGIADNIKISGNAWYVHYATGTDAGGDAGKNIYAPLKTAAQAHTNASNGDYIVFLDGHEETVTTQVLVTKSVYFLGGGASGGKSTVRFTLNHATESVFKVSAPFAHFDMIGFEGSSIVSTGGCIFSIQDTGETLVVKDCDFNLNNVSTGIVFGSVEGSGCNAILRNNTLTSTATTSAARPQYAIYFAEAPSFILAEDNVVDAGTLGFSNGYGIDSVNASTYAFYDRQSLLRGADFRQKETTLGHVHIGTATGSARSEWCDV